MPETTTETTTTETGSEVEGTQEQSFTQADVDALMSKVRGEEKRKAADRYASEAKSVEQKLADLERKHSEAEARVLRSDIAAKHGISAEARDLFLTGTDEETLTRQASSLAEMVTDRKKNGNVAPKEGSTTSTGKQRSEWAGVLDKISSRDS